MNNDEYRTGIAIVDVIMICLDGVCFNDLFGRSLIRMSNWKTSIGSSDGWTMPFSSTETNNDEWRTDIAILDVIMMCLDGV